VSEPETQAQEDPQIRSRLDKETYLPPIARLKMPKFATATAKVKWLWELGYEVKEISRGIPMKYQQVRNMVVNQPKRAHREDLPPLVVEIMDPVDDIQAILDAELDRSLMAGRKDRAKTRAANQFLGPEALRGQSGPEAEDEEDWVDEITEQPE